MDKYTMIPYSYVFYKIDDTLGWLVARFSGSEGDVLVKVKRYGWKEYRIFNGGTFDFSVEYDDENNLHLDKFEREEIESYGIECFSSVAKVKINGVEVDWKYDDYYFEKFSYFFEKLEQKGFAVVSIEEYSDIKIIAWSQGRAVRVKIQVYDYHDKVREPVDIYMDKIAFISNLKGLVNSMQKKHDFYKQELKQCLGTVGKYRFDTVTWRRMLVGNIICEPEFGDEIASKKNSEFWGNLDADKAKIQSMHEWRNPYYKIQNDDRVYSLDTDENNVLKQQILTASLGIRALVRTATGIEQKKWTDEFSDDCLFQLEKEVDCFRSFQEEKNMGFLDICGYYLGDFVIHHLGGKWAVVNEKLCILLSEKTCVFPMSLVQLYYNDQKKQHIMDAVKKLRKMCECGEL